MRNVLTIHIPQDNQVSFSLYAYGIKNVAERNNEEVIFSFESGSTVVLFYKFPLTSRAYIVTDFFDERVDGGAYLPGVDEKVHILGEVRGQSVRTFESLLKYLMKTDKNIYFRYPFNFWIKICSILKYRKKNIRSAIFTLLEHYKNHGKNLFYTENDFYLERTENEILKICESPKTNKEISDNFGKKEIGNFQRNYIKPLLDSNDLMIYSGFDFEDRKKRYVRAGA